MANNNPFDTIDQRLQVIEEALHQLINKPDHPPPITEKYLTTEQVCEILSISRVTLWSWQKSGIIQSFKIGSLRRYKQSDIEKLGEGKGRNE